MLSLVFCLGKLFSIAAVVAFIPALLLGGLASLVTHDLGIFVFIFVFGLSFWQVLVWMFKDSGDSDGEDGDDYDYGNETR